MSQVEKPQVAVTNERDAINIRLDHDHNHLYLDTYSRPSELQLWPPPRLQAYCVDHFFMECEIYHEQENARYSKLIAHSRSVFFEKNQRGKRGFTNPEAEPIRRQPARRAKEKNSKRQQQQRSVLSQSRPPDAPFKPARVEKAYVASPEGAMFRILSEFCKELELDQAWEDYRTPLQEKIAEVESQLRSQMENVKRNNNTPTKCVFGNPSELECRYCVFARTAADNVPVTPRKLAPPVAAYLTSEGGNGTGDAGIELRGINFVVDVCSGGEETMIVLVGFRGVLDLCAELFSSSETEGHQGVPHNPASLATHLCALLPRREQRLAKKV